MYYSLWLVFSGNYSLEHISIIGRSVDSNGKKALEPDFEAMTSGDDLPPPPSGKRKVIVAQRPNNFLWTLKVTSSKPHLYWRLNFMEENQHVFENVTMVLVKGQAENCVAPMLTVI